MLTLELSLSLARLPLHRLAGWLAAALVCFPVLFSSPFFSFFTSRSVWNEWSVFSLVRLVMICCRGNGPKLITEVKQASSIRVGDASAAADAVAA